MTKSITYEEFKEILNFKPTDEELEILAPEMKLDKLPSINLPLSQKLLRSYTGRKTYIEEVGFTFLSFEFAEEMQKKFGELDIKRFSEFYAGNCALALLLNDIGLTGKAYTLDPSDGEQYGFKVENKYLQEAISKNLVEFEDIHNINTSSDIDMVVASWIPYGGGQEFIELLERSNKPEYLFIIGESYGGCTASDEVFNWLEKHYEIIYDFDLYRPFVAIYDIAEIYRRR